MSPIPVPESFPPPIQRHPPERRQRRKEGIVLYSCCCCCCCCLHTIGGAIGATFGSAYAARQEPAVMPERKLPSPMALYWISFLLTVLIVSLCILATILVAGVVNHTGYILGEIANMPLWIGLSIILLGPAWMLGASLVMAILIAVRPPLRARPIYWRQLGRITGGTLIGSAAGVGIMYVIFLVLTVRR